jgi:site-specific DNA-methyltransferase (adenine-specific)
MQPYYEENGIMIYHGDCRDVLSFLPRAALVLTDPPYGLGKKLNGGSWGNAAWDVLQTDVVLSLLDLAPRVVIWGGNYYPLPPSRCWLSWFKPDAPPSIAHFELAWTNFDQNSRQFSHSVKAKSLEQVGHPTQKPLRLIQWCIQQSGVREGLIIDPFMGSGTTLRAAKDAGFRCIGVELKENYCELAAERLRQGALDFAAVGT